MAAWGRRDEPAAPTVRLPAAASGPPAAPVRQRIGGIRYGGPPDDRLPGASSLTIDSKAGSRSL